MDEPRMYKLNENDIFTVGIDVIISETCLLDKSYIGFDKKSSQIIDEIILRNIPNDLDIIKCKILKSYQEAI